MARNLSGYVFYFSYREKRKKLSTVDRESRCICFDVVYNENTIRKNIFCQRKNNRGSMIVATKKKNATYIERR